MMYNTKQTLQFLRSQDFTKMMILTSSGHVYKLKKPKILINQFCDSKHWTQMISGV